MRNTKITITNIFLLVTLLTVCCSGGEMNNNKVKLKSLKDLSAEELENLSTTKIFFGHQSVGNNILKGIQTVMKESDGIKLDIVEKRSIDSNMSGLIAHARIGQNVNPKSKIDEFIEIIEQGVGENADAVALKFCYVDIKKDTDVAKVFDEYGKGVEEIKKRYPNLKIVHFTTPLTVSKKTWKTWIKKMIGKNDFWEFASNIKRNQYNQLLVKKYQNQDPILDIAKIESTKPDGSRQTFTLSGSTYYSMVPEYSTDGGHLNEMGQRKVAEQFLVLMANLSR